MLKVIYSTMIRSILSNSMFHSALNDSLKRGRAVVNSIRFGYRSFWFTSLKWYGRLLPCVVKHSHCSTYQGGNGGKKLTIPVSTRDLHGTLEEEKEFNKENLITAASIQEPAGKLYECDSPSSDSSFIPQVPLNEKDFKRKARVLVLCTGGTVSTN